MGRVLLVDSDQSVARHTRYLLERRGHTCGLASSLDAAQRMLDAAPLPDLVIVAAALDGHGGYDLVRRARVRDPDLPVLVTFDEDDAALSSDAWVEGAFDAFVKVGATAVRLAGRGDAILSGIQTSRQGESAARQLAATNAVLHAHLETTSDGVLIVDHEDRVASFNDRFLAIFGLERQATEGIDGQVLLTRVFGQIRGEEPAEAPTDPEAQIIDQVADLDGGQVVQWSVRPVRLTDGALIGRAFGFRDISAQRAAERQIRFQSELLERIPTAVAATDLRGAVEYWSPSAERLHGWPSREVCGVNVRQFLFDETDNPAVDALRTLQAGDRWQGEVPLRRRDGTAFPALLTLTRIGESPHSHPRIVGVIVDLSERRSLEAKLLQAQKMEAVGTLAGGLAHDFNNLLTGVLGSAAIARAEVEPGTLLAEVTEMIERASLRARDLCQQLLTFSRAEKPQLVPLSPVEILPDVVKLVERTFPRDLHIRVQVADSLPAMLGDRSQLSQALMNLLLNARDAMDGRGAIVVRAYLVTRVPADALHPAATDAAQYVALEVEDSGPGMSAELLARVFEPFFTTKGAAGTGLGLPMVFSIARAHGGQVRAWTTPGVGTRFTLFVPASAKPAHPKPAEVTEEEMEQYRGDERVLVVDDEAMVRNVGARVLRRFGYIAEEAAGGPEALQMLDIPGRRVDAVILDIVMPEMEGPEVFRRMREIDADLPIVLCSGYSVAGIVDDLLHSGAAGYVQKPYQVRELLPVLRRALDRRARRRRDQARPKAAPA